MKKNKLSIEKFRIIQLSNLSNIRGGTGGHGGPTEIPTFSALTTFTTDPDVPCPSGNTDDTNNGNVTIPTLGSK